MKYYFSKTIAKSFDESVVQITDALKTEGFGIITEIRMHDKFREKLDVDFKKYTILGACNPSFAYKALQMEDKIGTMLPCNVLVIEQGTNRIEIVAIDPVASMMAVGNPGLTEVARIVSETLKNIVESM
jgi:uncharacterized protein (DUF302 family)